MRLGIAWTSFQTGSGRQHHSEDIARYIVAFVEFWIHVADFTASTKRHLVRYHLQMPQPDQSKPQQEPIDKPKGFDAILRKLLGTPPKPKKAAKPGQHPR